MAVLHVNPTRMSLLDLKRRTSAAKRGHKLLKDKQDGLMKHFLSIVRLARDLRAQVEEDMSIAFRSFLLASAWMSETQVKNALSSPQASVRLSVETVNVMSVKMPKFTVHRGEFARTYAFATTNALLDRATEAFQRAFDTLIRLAEAEKQAENMAIELETTRRRVNALEYKMLPDLRDTVKFIKMKLDESERGAIVSVMRIKSSLQEKEK